MSRPLHILWVKTELLHPVDKGGRIRTIEMLKRLKRRHRVTYLTLDDGTAAPDAHERAREYCHDLVCVPLRLPPRSSPGFYAGLLRSLLTPLPYAIERYSSRAMRAAIAAQARRSDIDVVVSDFLVPAVNFPAGVPCSTLLFQHNVEAMIWKRHWQMQRNPLATAFFKDQWRRMAGFEARACRSFDHVVAVSEDDCETMRQDYGLVDVTAIPTGVDTDFFRPAQRRAPRPRSMVFTGSMDWMPNQDAIRYFVSEIMPGILSRVPDATLTVVGRSPGPDLLELARARPDVTVTGRVDDVRPYLEEAACFVVPIRIGGGTRLKIFEAMAMEKPVVTTSIGAEGLPVRDGVDLLKADDPSAFADAVVRILCDVEGGRTLGLQAAATVRETFGWDPVVECFAAVCQLLVASREQARTIVQL